MLLSEFWRIKIDKQWAVIFRWENGNAYDVCILDYHG
ncbi:type II toxin-antitoxin system RelE/ParE family toxin [Legionella brunensis]